VAGSQGNAVERSEPETIDGGEESGDESGDDGGGDGGGGGGAAVAVAGVADAEDEASAPAPAGGGRGSLAAALVAQQMADLDDLVERTRGLPDQRPVRALTLAQRELERQFREVVAEDATVLDEMARLRGLDERALASAREAVARQRESVRKRKAVYEQVGQNIKELCAQRVEFLEEQRVAKAARLLREVETTYSDEDLGAGQLRGGDEHHRQTRWRALKQIWGLLPPSAEHAQATLTQNLWFDFCRWDDLNRNGTGARHSYGRHWGVEVRTLFRRMAEDAAAGQVDRAVGAWRDVVARLPPRGSSSLVVVPASGLVPARAPAAPPPRSRGVPAPGPAPARAPFAPPPRPRGVPVAPPPRPRGILAPGPAPARAPAAPPPRPRGGPGR